VKQYVYLAGPISGLTLEGAQSWRNEVGKALDSSEVTCLTPLRGKQFLSDKSALNADTSVYNNPMTTFKAITRRDMFDTLRATCLFVNLKDAVKVSIGTCMELAWAYQNQIPSIVIMEKTNLHHHAMLDEACTYIVETVDEAVAIAKHLLNAKE